MDVSRSQFCSTIGGVYDDEGATCTLQERSDGIQPSCYKAAAGVLFYDDLGSCYDFQRLDNSVYRQRYRLTDTCVSQLNQFQLNVANSDGMCAGAQSWRGASGVFIPAQYPLVTVPLVPDARDCNVHRSTSRCESGLCTWSDTPTYVQCVDGGADECIAMCSTMGGNVVDGECVIPNCRPSQMSEVPCHNTNDTTL